MALVEVRTVSDRVFQALRDKILRGDIAPDAPVRQDALALELGVSKIPVREALTRLEAQGLVTSFPHRGYVVRPLTCDEAVDVFDLRFKLEPGAAALGAERANGTEHEEAREAFAALDKALRTRAGDTGRRNREFHLALVRPSGRSVAVETIERLLTLAERYVSIHLKPTGRPDRARREHGELLEAWLARRTKAVRKMTEDHITATLKDLSAQLRPTKASCARTHAPDRS
jgi:DNA-binding GntR family transcriptional regulator